MSSRIAVVGYGFVGRGTAAVMEHCEKVIVDPAVPNATRPENVGEVQATFVCVPTNGRPSGHVDTSHLDSVLSWVRYKEGWVVIRSTVTPDWLEKAAGILGSRMMYWPEFARQANGVRDFILADMMLVGCDDRSLAGEFLEWFSENTVMTRSCRTAILTYRQASLAKYIVNSWLATKVAFFSELRGLFQDQPEYDLLVEAISLDPRVGSSHMRCPGDDGRLGFDGACFPKDTIALDKYAEDYGADLTILRQAIVSNIRLRGSR